MEQRARCDQNIFQICDAQLRQNAQRAASARTVACRAARLLSTFPSDCCLTLSDPPFEGGSREGARGRVRAARRTIRSEHQSLRYLGKCLRNWWPHAASKSRKALCVESFVCRKISTSVVMLQRENSCLFNSTLAIFIDQGTLFWMVH